MSSRRVEPLEARIGFAADPSGAGIAYVRVRSARGERLVRLPFQVDRMPSLYEREVGYAALTAVAGALQARGVARVRFEIEDGELVRDLHEHRELPASLVLPYVRLGCQLNRFKGYTLALAAQPGDLQARARAEVALHLAA